MRFEIDRASIEEPFVFHLLDDDDRTLLVGRASSNQEECLDLMRVTIERLDEAASFEVREEAGTFFSVVRDAAGSELARSEALGSKRAAEERSAAIVEAAMEMERYEASFTTRAAGRKAAAIGLERIGAGGAMAAKLYDFGRASTSGEAGFEEIDLDDGTFWFHFNDADGRALLYSRSFASAGDRAKRIRAVIKSAAKEGRLDRREEAGGWFFVVSSRNGREIARSRRFASAEEMEGGISYVIDTAAGFEGLYGAAKRSDANRDAYDFARASISGAAGFETFRADDGLYYFHFNDESGRAILYSQGYSSAGARDAGVRSVIKNAGTDERYQEAQDEDGAYFVLKAANNAEIGRSPAFADAGELAAAMAFLKATAPGYAEAWGVQLEAPPTTRRETFTLDVERDEAPPPVVPLPAASVVPPPAPSAPEHQPETRSRPWWLWLLLVLLLLALLLLALRSCRSGDGRLDEELGRPPATPESGIKQPSPATTPAGVRRDEEPDDEGPTDEEPVVEEPMEEGPGGAEPGPTGEVEEGGPLAEPIGPDGSALGLPPGTLAWRIAGFLSDPESRFPHTFTMDRVRYPKNSPVLNREGYPEVDELVVVLGAYPGSKIELLGHIDGTESDVYTGPYQDGEITLSAIRARCIYRKLLERGIAAERMSFRGSGTSAPLEADDTEQGQQRNRRQEIVILGRA